ncbi:hypothetical protein GJ496_001373 [Pomphorhynchus laevis]|nr:hypothetical protein GJ496_001373 [Pomphorhynchus laevis]
MTEEERKKYEKELNEVINRIKELRAQLHESIKRERELYNLLKSSSSSDSLFQTLQSEMTEIVEDVKSSHSYRVAANQVTRVSHMLDPGIQAIKRGVDVIGSNEISKSVLAAIGGTVDKVKSFIPTMTDEGNDAANESDKNKAK